MEFDGGTFAGGLAKEAKTSAAAELTVSAGGWS